MQTDELLATIRRCDACKPYLPLGPKPLVQFSPSARILIIGQAPGIKAHTAGLAWSDQSGERLREWMGVTKAEFYESTIIAHVPMGFCYPGKGKSGDLAPRPECAPLWHETILNFLPKIKLTLLIGSYSQIRYLGERRKENLTETVRSWREYTDDGYLPLVHPSPRNGIWLSKNPWFEMDIVPYLKATVSSLIRP